LFQDAGVNLGEEALTVIDIIQLAIDDLLTAGSEDYSRFLTYIREKLAENADTE
jgi:hypothetical protein